jgi:feruloyl-CoA synthase
LRPRFVYAADGQRFAAAIAAAGLDQAELVVSANPPGDRPVTRFADLAATPAGPAVAHTFARVGPDTVAKILFTSGSTGQPKGVVNTQRMMCANQQAIVQLWPFLTQRPPVIVDWLPWHHTFGGNHNFNMVLRHGGTLYIDEGKPAPGLVARTVANLREISPTLYFNVPRGYDMLLPYLERDAELAEIFFRHLDLLFYAAAALPQNLWTRLEEVSLAARGRKVTMVSAWGSTETAPMVTTVHFHIDHAGVVGLPAPGCELKLVPIAGRYELRVRGPNVTPGYWTRLDLTAAAFDEDGFYCIGDAGRLADSGDPARGIEFDGRIAEDFKLMSGTWVQVGNLRLAAIGAGAPLIQDVVVTGHDREEIGILVFPNPVGCRSVCPDIPADAPMSALITNHKVRDYLTAGLKQLAQCSTGSSNRITRALLLEEPPSIDANEITDKGYINQRAVLLRRADEVNRLYANAPDPEVIVVG